MEFQYKKLNQRINYIKTVELIEVNFVQGSGTPEDPVTSRVQYWTKEGALVGEVDANKVSYPIRSAN